MNDSLCQSRYHVGHLDKSESIQFSGYPEGYEDVFYNVQEAAMFLRVKPATIYDWVHQQKIPFRKHGKRLAFLKAELRAFSDKSLVPVYEEIS